MSGRFSSPHGIDTRVKAYLYNNTFLFHNTTSNTLLGISPDGFKKEFKNNFNQDYDTWTSSYGGLFPNETGNFLNLFILLV